MLPSFLLKDMRLSDYLETTSAVSTFLPLVLAAVKWKSFHGKFNFLFALFLVAAITETICSYMGSLGINNLQIFRIYRVIEFCLLALFFRAHLRTVQRTIWILYLIVIAPIVGGIDWLVVGPNRMDIISGTYCSILLAFLSIYSFYAMLKADLVEKILDEPVFWINSAVLIYFAGNFLLFLFSNYITKFSPQRHDLLWAVIHSTFNFSYNVLMCIGIWKLRKI